MKLKHLRYAIGMKEPLQAEYLSQFYYLFLNEEVHTCTRKNKKYVIIVLIDEDHAKHSRENAVEFILFRLIITDPWIISGAISKFLLYFRISTDVLHKLNK